MGHSVGGLLWLPAVPYLGCGFHPEGCEKAAVLSRISFCVLGGRKEAEKEQRTNKKLCKAKWRNSHSREIGKLEHNDV